MSDQESGDTAGLETLIAIVLIGAAAWFAWGNWSTVSYWDRPGFYDRMLRSNPDAGLLAKLMWYQMTHARPLFLGACIATVAAVVAQIAEAGDYAAVGAWFIALAITGFFSGRAYDAFAACAQVQQRWTCDDWLLIYALIAGVLSSLLLITFALKFLAHLVRGNPQ